MCSLGFEGKGYSDTFTANMSAIVMGRLRSEEGPATIIQVTHVTDDICAPCPKRRGRLCADQGKIAKLDRAHGAALDLRGGETITWDNAQERITKLAPKDLDTLCAGCRWLDMGMCKHALARLKADHSALDGAAGEPTLQTG